MRNAIASDVVILGHAELSLGESSLDKILGSLGVVSSLGNNLGAGILRKFLLRDILCHGSQLEGLQVDSTLAQGRSIRTPSLRVGSGEACEAYEDEAV